MYISPLFSAFPSLTSQIQRDGRSLPGKLGEEAACGVVSLKGSWSSDGFVNWLLYPQSGDYGALPSLWKLGSFGREARLSFSLSVGYLQSKSHINYTSPLGKRQHWLQNTPRFNPISLSILCHLRANSSLLQTVSHHVVILYTKQVPKVQLVIASLLDRTKAVIKVPPSALRSLVSDRQLI